MKNRSIYYIRLHTDIGMYIIVRKTYKGVIKFISELPTKSPDWFKEIYDIEILDMTDEEGNRYD